MTSRNRWAVTAPGALALPVLLVTLAGCGADGAIPAATEYDAHHFIASDAARFQPALSMNGPGVGNR
jgi:hypothetical protein